jgi:hypothetical protein
MINQEDVKGGNAESLCAALEELRAAYGIGEAIAYVMTPSWTSMAQRPNAAGDGASFMTAWTTGMGSPDSTTGGACRRASGGEL